MLFIMRMNSPITQHSNVDVHLKSVNDLMLYLASAVKSTHVR